MDRDVWKQPEVIRPDRWEAKLSNRQIRRNILRLLYATHNHDPHGVIELDELVQQLDLPSSRVRSNLRYLCDPKKELVEMRETSTAGGRIYHFVRITAAGIDLLDDPSEFNARFPSQVIYQYVAGDNLAVTIGDNNSEVTVGKDIVRLQFGTSHGLEDVCSRFIASLESRPDLNATEREEITVQLGKLQSLLRSPRVDLGEAQRIRQFLVDHERGPAARTAALFSHPAVVKPIQQTVERLIGRS